MEAKEIDTGGPAFPTGKQHTERLAGTRYAHRIVSDGSGMTLRDYVAAKAMQSLISKYGFISDEINFAAEQSYVIADAMLEARTK